MANNFLSAIIDRFEGDKAVLVLTDGQHLVWPANLLPAGLKEGDGLKVLAETDAELALSQEEKAKHILKQLLKTNE
ncbi:MAG: DUF3006 domain-containing protein [Patescibacteria group bacterium]